MILFIPIVKAGADIKADELPEQTFKRQKYPGLCIPDAELTVGEKVIGLKIES